MTEQAILNVNKDYAENYGLHMPEDYVFKSRTGLDKELVAEISWMKSEMENAIEMNRLIPMQMEGSVG